MDANGDFVVSRQGYECSGDITAQRYNSSGSPSPAPKIRGESVPMDLDSQFRTAIAHHRAGRTGEAESGYRDVLRQRPDHADALHLLGLVVAQAAPPHEALPLLARAAKPAPQRPDFHADRGEALRQVGNVTAAEACFRQAIALAPRLSGSSLQLWQRLEDARPAPRGDRLLYRGHPIAARFPRVLYNLGNALREEGRTAAAIDAYHRALTLQVASRVPRGGWRQVSGPRSVASRKRPHFQIPSYPIWCRRCAATEQRLGSAPSCQRRDPGPSASCVRAGRPHDPPHRVVPTRAFQSLMTLLGRNQ